MIIAAIGTACEVYPLEYAYLGGSVQQHERTSANCRNYQHGLHDQTYTETYVHCDGTQLRLNYSDFGSDQYSSKKYYVWKAEITSHLLFILPTRVNLTTITLHYYNDSIRGLPRLRFYAVPDDFNVWESPSGSYSYIEVAAMSPESNNTGPNNLSVNFNLNTRKILMSKFSSTFSFAVSEVQFSNCSGKSLK